jgi:hypothetical protein
MSVEASLQAALAALVSGRCYPLVAPDGTAKPYITFQVIDDTETVTLDGPSGTERLRVQVSVWDKTYGGAKTLLANVKATMAAASFVNIPLPGGGDTYEPQTQLYGYIKDFAIWTTPP